MPAISIRNKIVANASWMVGCRIAQALLGLVVGVIAARYLGPSNFGVINYAAAMVAFAVPIMQLGLNNIMVQELVNSPEKEGAILGTSILMNFVSAIACIVGILVTVCFLNAGEKVTIIVCGLYSTILIFQAVEQIQYWFQAKFLSKYIALTSFFAYLVVSGYKIALLVMGMSVYWFAVANAFDLALIAVTYLVLYRKLGSNRLSISLQIAKRMFAKSRYYIISNLMFVFLVQTDRIMIKNIMDDANVGFYSAAMTCAGMLNFVYSAIIDSFRPVIFENKKKDEILYERNVSLLYGIIFYMTFLECFFMTLLAPFVIKLLSADAFSASSVALQIVVWYIMFAYTGYIRGIWILAESKQKYLLLLNLICALGNVILNIFLIPVWGIAGAAAATVFSQIFSTVILGFIFKPLRQNNFLLFRGLNPFFLKEMYMMKN